ncbi:uncharacterized protein LACBIDRAFT_336116 [Laccaria bicolor S238N-H82]|uniref:Predicted protein n=1 Tax=Laccaria bicolor (strain S238N-H82 / ATCC MYA-4686) TaxID=486041 RepID=B0DSH7_LACBS|nr:uncharacterized protein LACBIDRAFT_309514 [Laccaria bicolor S238N-H82]XP_001891078.1 uncharacterized protein LACBIDRAFT_336116 [Laccaria bicolor S238N-H82]EDQ98271.1 predicted protein [Laccaria bicolor S238N-H82]EDR02475.1 predicted protein [Laccaria bicolor S238N-H82]|eukprot:XP_001886838.1 predicted protein [Laccaria bicolor S238N-H82]
MASAAQAHYANRTSDGVYDSLSDLIASSGSGFLANCEYDKDFFRKTSWRGLDFQNKDGSEFCVNLFGEIQPASLGTKHSALGDFYIGTKDKPTYVTPESKVKNRFALGVPSLCPENLAMMFQDQLVALNEIVKSEQDQEDREYLTKEWLSPSAPGKAGDIITITSPTIYKAPQTSPSESRVPTIKRILKRSRGSSSKKDEPVEVSQAANVSSSSDGQETDGVVEYKIGQLYEPNRLYDYGGNLFRNSGCKLIQHEIIDVNHNIIPPWDQYAALRTGTLVMATVTLHCFTMNVKDFNGVETGKRRKIYQINFHRLLVIGDSIAEVLTRTVHPGYGADDDTDAPHEPRDSSADRAMASFKVKKIKLTKDDASSSSVKKVSERAESSTTPSNHSASRGVAASTASTSKGKQPVRNMGKAKASSSAKITPSSSTTIFDDDVSMEEGS